MPNFENKKLNSEKLSTDYTVGNESREAHEAAEGLATAKSSAPKNRFQDKQQLSDVSNAENVKADSSSFTRRKTKSTGGTVKQEVASRVAITDADFSGPFGAGTAPSRANLKTLVFSGDGGTIISNAANTPIVGATDRSGASGRFEKKLDATNKKINYAVSEQVIQEYDNPAPLGDSGNEVQGYYGTPKNDSARSQKHSGAHPGDPLFMRSLDMVTKDEIVFINGQYIKDITVNDELEPTKSYTVGQLEANAPLTDNYNGATAGNYIPTMMKVTLSKEGTTTQVTSVEFDVEDASIESEDSAIVSQASTNRIIDRNKSEIARQKVDSNAGRETEPHWNPTARAIAQPTQTHWLLSTIESEVGATIATAYKFANKAFAYQLNKTAKDGQHLLRPMREMLTGDVADYISSEDFASDGLYGFNPFDRSAAAYAARRNGSAATLALLNSSANRYSSKADVLTNPTGLRQFFQIADNNMNIFRLKKEFGAALNSVDVFSTIDRDYDPLLPVCMTDKVGLVYTINPQTYSACSRSTSNGEFEYASGKGPYKYAYANRMSNYGVKVEHPLWQGIINWIDEYAGKIYSLISDETSGDVVWNIPIHHSTTTLALFDFLVMAAVPYIQKVRINSHRDVLDYEVNFEYPYDLIDVAHFNPMNAVNYSMPSHDEPLQSRVMIPSSAIRWVMPEFTWGIGENTNGNNGPMYVQPWYFSEQQFTPTGAGNNVAGYNLKDMGSAMTFPIIRSGVRMSYLDTLYSMSERDIRLSLDRMIVPSSYNNRATAGYSGTNSYAVYKYGQNSDGIPAVKGEVSILDYLKTPRELGWFMSAPHGLLRCADTFLPHDDASEDEAYIGVRESDGSGLMMGDTSFRAYTYYAGTEYPNGILDADSVNVDRAQSFMQNWDCSPAAYMNRPNAANQLSSHRTRRNIGFALSVNGVLTINGANVTALSQKSLFKPFTSGLSAGGTPYGAQTQLSEGFTNVVSLAQAFWGRLQKLPMAISPWDTCDFADSRGAQFDPYDGAYYFGMAGTMASDYNQDMYNKIMNVQDQGWLYVEDPYVKDSPVMRDGFKFTM